MDQKIHLGTVGHFGLAVDDPKASARWWQSLFDLDVIFEGEDYIGLTNASVTIVLSQGKARPETIGHMSFHVPNVATLETALKVFKARGVDVEDPGPRDRPRVQGLAQHGTVVPRPRRLSVGALGTRQRLTSAHGGPLQPQQQYPRREPRDVPSDERIEHVTERGGGRNVGDAELQLRSLRSVRTYGEQRLCARKESQPRGPAKFDGIVAPDRIGEIVDDEHRKMRHAQSRFRALGNCGERGAGESIATNDSHVTIVRREREGLEEGEVLIIRSVRELLDERSRTAQTFRNGFEALGRHGDDSVEHALDVGKGDADRVSQVVPNRRSLVHDGDGLL